MKAKVKYPRRSIAHAEGFRGSGDRKICAAGTAAGGQQIPSVECTESVDLAQCKQEMSLGACPQVSVAGSSGW